MTQEKFAELLAERDRVRGIYAGLDGHIDVCITLSAPGAAPKGLDWTGDPLFTVPTSLVGMPTVTLPVLSDGACRWAFKSSVILIKMPNFSLMLAVFLIFSDIAQRQKAQCPWGLDQGRFL